MEMYWHWLIVIYIFLGGIGAGAYLTSFAAEKGWLETTSLNKAGYYLAVPVVAIGTLFLILDLGQGLAKPWILIRLFTNFQSVMTWSTYLLSAFIIIGLIKAFFIFKNIAAPTVLTWAGAILAIAVGTDTGFLLSVIQAIPFWNTGIIPVIFVISALSTGLAAVSLLSSYFSSDEVHGGREVLTQLMFLASQLIIISLFFGVMFSGAKGPAATASALSVISGSYAFVFWGLFISLGLVFPLVIFILQYLCYLKKENQKNDETEHVCVQDRHYSYLVIFANIAVLLGGLALRAIIIFAALPIWNGINL